MMFKKKTENVLIFDIGSASVGGTVVVLNQYEKPNIVFSTRSQIVFQEELNFDHFVHSMLSILFNVSMQLRSGGIPNIHGKINRVLCVLSSPWYVSQTKVFTVKKEKSFRVTEKLIENLLTDAEDMHRKDAVQVEGDPLFIEKSVIQFKVNGYSVTDAVGSDTTNLEVTILSTIISTDVYEKVKMMINKVFNVDDFVFRSFTKASYAVIRDLFWKEKNFLLADISGETTSVSVVHDAVLRNSSSFPLGHNYFKRSVQSSNATEKHDTIPIISYETNKEWSASFKQALIEISKGTPLPSMLFLTGGSEYVAIVKELIDSTDFSEILFVQSPFNVSILNSRQLRPCCTFDSEVKSDAFLTLATIYMNRYLFASKSS